MAYITGYVVTISKESKVLLASSSVECPASASKHNTGSHDALYSTKFTSAMLHLSGTYCVYLTWYYINAMITYITLYLFPRILIDLNVEITSSIVALLYLLQSSCRYFEVLSPYHSI